MVISKTLSRDFLLSFLAQFVFSLVFCVLIPTVPLYLSRFAATESEIGILVGVFSVSSLILRPFVGRALLTRPEKSLMLAGSLIYVVSCLAYLIAPPFWPLFILRIFQGAGMALFSTSSYTFVANIVPEAHRGRLMSVFSLSGNLPWALGPFFGMVLINHFSFTAAFLVCTALSVSSFYMTMKMSRREFVPLENEISWIASFFSRQALPSSIIALLLNIIWGAISTFFPLYALRHGVSNPGIFYVFLCGTIFIGRGLGGRLLDKYGHAKVVIPCLLLITIAVAILAFSTTLPMFILAAVLMGVGWSLPYPSLLIQVTNNAGSARGPAMGTFTALGDVGSGLGPMVMGLVLEWTSYPVMFLGLALTGASTVTYYHYAIAKKAPTSPLARDD